MRADIAEAIEATACRGGALDRGGERATPSARSISATREIIRRFLENLPDEGMTVLELREALDG